MKANWLITRWWNHVGYTWKKLWRKERIACFQSLLTVWQTFHFYKYHLVMLLDSACLVFYIHFIICQLSLFFFCLFLLQLFHFNESLRLLFTSLCWLWTPHLLASVSRVLGLPNGSPHFRPGPLPTDLPIAPFVSVFLTDSLAVG